MGQLNRWLNAQTGHKSCHKEKHIAHNLRLSLKAYHGLQEIALATGYAHPSRNMHRLSTMITAWASHGIAWQDTRPPSVQASDSLADRLGIARQWSPGLPPNLHALGPLPFTYITQIAHRHMIAPLSRQRVIIQGANLTRPRAYPAQTPYNTASAVLEAVGARWLTPLSDLPHAPQYRDYRPIYERPGRALLG